MNKMAWDFIMLLRIAVIDFLELSIWYFGAVVDHRRKKKSLWVRMADCFIFLSSTC